jgi:hypothetical protein
MINTNTVLGSLTHTFSTSSLQGGTTMGATGDPPAVQPGTNVSGDFSVHQGDKLDLTKILAGAPLTADLSNLHHFVKVLGHSSNDPGFGPGTKTTLEIAGPHGTGIVNLQNSGKLDLKDLLSHNSLILPPH